MTTTSIFGTFYKEHPPLQAAIDHAERAHALLERMTEDCLFARCHASVALYPSDAEQWLVGRPDDLLVYMHYALADWREGRRTAGETATIIEAYLCERVHHGLQAEFGLCEFECCLTEQDFAPTLACVIEPDGFAHRARGAECASVTVLEEVFDLEDTLTTIDAYSGPPPTSPPPSSSTRIYTPTLTSALT